VEWSGVKRSEVAGVEWSGVECCVVWCRVECSGVELSGVWWSGVWCGVRWGGIRLVGGGVSCRVGAVWSGVEWSEVVYGSRGMGCGVMSGLVSVWWDAVESNYSGVGHRVRWWGSLWWRWSGVEWSSAPEPCLSQRLSGKNSTKSESQRNYVVLRSGSLSSSIKTGRKWSPRELSSASKYLWFWDFLTFLSIFLKD